MKPEDAPTIPRTTDPATGEQKIDGGQALTGIASLYDYAGRIKGQLEALIDAEITRQAAEERSSAKKKGRH